MSFIEVEIFFTKYYKHAYHRILEFDSLDFYDGVLCCSGDGIVHEVFNGLMHKKQQEGFSELDFVVGHIPAGTGNGHSQSLAYEAEENTSVLNSVYFILRGITKKIDLCEIEFLNSKEKAYSFQCFNWCFIADVDLESEV